MKATLLNHLKLPRMPSIARVLATAENIETRTPSASRKAKPLTDAVDATNSTAAVISVTAFASTIVRKPFE